MKYLFFLLTLVSILLSTKLGIWRFTIINIVFVKLCSSFPIILIGKSQG